MDCTALIIALIGVGGTLLGTILGWLLNSLSRIGRLKIYIVDWKETFQRLDVLGCMIDITSIEQTEYYGYELKLDLYNNSSKTKIMRNIEIEHLQNKKVVLRQTPHDKALREPRNYGCVDHDIGVLNISPNQVLQFTLCNVYNKQNGIENLWQSDRVRLSYMNEKNRKKTINIKSLNYNKPFNEIQGNIP